VPIPGGQAGHTVAPVDVAGCYAPGGRYPLPSSVLMTAITAKVAGCKQVLVVRSSSSLFLPPTLWSLLQFF
jgi:phosphoribosyl-ATP pyrophosphohydrolase/phosphoribosyl-AMP cyclohydrolase/histidinol dehydrogenase